MFVFFSHIQLQSVPMQNSLIGLKAEAIGKKKMGDSNSAHLASGSCALGFWFLLTWLLFTGLLVPQG